VRAGQRKNGVTINAVAGTRVVFLGLDLSEKKREGCLGFAIQRHDPAKDETVWLRGKKTFAATDPGVGPGATVPTRDHPVQGFWWADYEVAPASKYTYKVVPRYGTPEKLTSGPPATVDVTTETELGKPHSIFFNRGAVASQEYARDFNDVLPKDVVPPELQAAAYRYLSHGLYEALLAFIARADGPEWSLDAAVYEFNWVPVLEALGEASKRKAKVSIVYDAIAGTSGPRAKSIVAIAKAGIGDLCIPRTKGKIMHNKFFVLSKNEKPVAVWTGSTNISENGIFGHLNVGHSVDNPAVAAEYLRYWAQLKDDPDRDTERAWVDTNDPTPPPEEPWTAPITTVFSPHSTDDVLKRYAAIAGSAADGLCMTFAFGMNDLFKTVYRRKDDVLRMALMEDYGTGKTKAAEATEIKSTIQPLPNVVVSIGGSIPTNGFDAWVAEAKGLTQNVQWVHTKFMLVDPLSASPTVVTGSANFSSASTDTNDENMLVIRGDLRTADIYFTEYMRLFAHYGFREAVAIAIERHEQWHPGHLETDWKQWLPPYFTPGDDRETRRRYFSTGKTS
jgi:phosphatidylserine/phosphatidylglycerophosphate/cardiolipin synthase-like enzyme